MYLIRKEKFLKVLKNLFNEKTCRYLYELINLSEEIQKNIMNNIKNIFPKSNF